MKKIIPAAMLLIFIISSCEKNKGLWYNKNWEKEHPTGQISGTVVCDTGTVVSYSATIQPIINQYCATSGCHVSHGSSLNYTNFYNLVSDARGTPPNDIMSRLDLPTTNSLHMPQSSGFLNACDTIKIKQWIHAGCRNN